MKKKLLGIFLACLVLVVAAVSGCAPASSGEQNTTLPPVAEEAAVKLYWNVDRQEFVGDSSAGMNSRQREADGFYSVRFAVDGEQVTYKVDKARLLEQIDSMDIMGLEIDGNGVITAVHKPEDITGGEVVSMSYVVIAGEDTITVSSDEALEKDYKTFEINEHTGFYNVTGMDPVGFTDTPITGDRIRAFQNEDGVLTHVFIVERYGYWAGETVMKYCEHCKQEVEFRVWEEKYALPTGSAHWILENKVTLSAQHKLGANAEVILDLNGKTVTGPDSKRVYALTGENAFLAILDSSEEQSGGITGSGSPDNGSIIYVRYGTFELYGGTIDASQIATVQYASAVRVNNDCVFNMYGGKIIGGKVVNPANKEDEVTNAGYGGTMYVTGIFNMYDGEITGGSCVESGGNIFVGKTGTLNLHGGEVSNGTAAKKGGNIAGTGKVNIYAVTVSGGSAKTYGGNIFTGKGGVVTLSDEAAIISGGSAKQGGNIYIENGAAVKMQAGKIHTGISAAHGGAVAVYGVFDCNGGEIYNNGAREQGGNIFVGKTGALSVNGGSIAGGGAGTKGGNIAGTGYITLYSAYVGGGSAKSYGGNIFCGKGSTVALRSEWVTVTGGTAVQGGNLYIENGSKVTMDDGKIESGNATAHGGSVAVYGVLDFNGGSISDSAAAEQGGNIFVGRAGSLTMNGGSVQNGTADTKGGNIAGTGTINLAGGKISNGVAAEYGGNLFVSGTVTMTGGTIEGGKSVNGGGVTVNGATYLMTGGVIQGGEAEQDGGCVYIARNVDSEGNTLSLGSFTMQGGEIIGGTSARFGGNVFAGKECTFILTDGKLLSGTSGQKGGNLNLTGIVVIEGGLISGGTSKNGGNINTAGTLEIRGGTVKDGTVSNSTKYDRNIFVEGGSFTVSGGDIAGGVRIKKTTGAVLTGTAKITNTQGFENLTLDKGIAVSLGDLAKGAEIGINPTSTVFATDAVEGDVSYFTSDAAGKIVVYKDGTLSLEKEQADEPVTEVIDWTSADSLPTTTGKYRLMQNVTLSKAHAVEDGNTVELDLNGFSISGTNIRIFQFTGSGATLSIYNSKETGGIIKPARTSAYTNYGGIVYMKSAGNTFNLNGGTLDASAITLTGKKGQGGAVYVGAGNIFNMAGGTIIGTTATQGGSAYVQAGTNPGTFNLSGGTVMNGTAGTGGNICAPGAFNMTGGTVKGGTATGNATGGNIYTTPGSNGSFTMTGGTIEGLVRVNSTGSITLGGTAKIVGGATNLTLSDKPATLQTTGFSTGAEISVNLEYDAYASEDKSFGQIGVAGDEQYLKLDGEGEIVVTDSKLYLAETVCAHTNTKVENAKTATCTDDGYTGDTVCADCGELITVGQTIAASGHNFVDGECTNCGEPSCYHTNTKVENAKAATCTDDGYTGDTVCADCGELITAGQIIAASGHNFVDGECTDCDEIELYPGYEKWVSTDSLPTTDGKYYLTAPVNLTSVQNVTGNVTLELNGMTVSGNNTDQIYNIGEGGVLTIRDSVGTGVITGGSTTGNGGTIYVNSGSQFNLYSGTISGGQATNGTGGNVYVEAGATAGIFNMYGGTVTGGTAKQGGNIYVAAGKDASVAAIFNLYGGTVSSGTGTAHAGNVAALGVMTMSGGEITGGICTASSISANVLIKPGADDCVFTMTGGKIAGHVRSNATGSIALGGTAKIAGGTTGLTFSKGSMTTTGFSAGAEISVNSTAYGEENSFGTGVAGDEAYIHSDDGATCAITAEGKLYLVCRHTNTKVENAKAATCTESGYTGDTVCTDCGETVSAGTSIAASGHSFVDGKCTGCSTDLYPGYEKWVSTNSLPTAAGKYYLADHVDVTSVTEIAADVVLELNGMTVSGNNATQIYNIAAGGILTIQDTVGTGTITGGSTTGNGSTVYVSAGGTLNLQGGTISGGQATSGTGGNVYVEAGATAGVFNMSGGTVAGGTAKQGGNIYLAAGNSTKTGGTFNLYGGTVSSGTGTAHAGNVAALGVMTMSGGEITGGICSASPISANILIKANKNAQICSFSMTGGQINGGVRQNDTGSISLGGTAKIAGGTTGLTFSKGSMTTTGFSAGAELSVNSTAYGETNSFGTGVAGDEAYIHSDGGAACAITEDGKLYLVAP